MRAGAGFVLVAVVLLAAGAQGAKHKFKNGEKVILWANKGTWSLASLRTPAIPQQRRATSIVPTNMRAC